MIKNLVAAAKGRIDVIAGGGVRSSNLGLLRQETNAPVFHSSAIVDVGGNETASKTEIMLLEQLLNEWQLWQQNARQGEDSAKPKKGYQIA